MRSYILLKTGGTLTEEQLFELAKQYESIEGVEFASHVIGAYDYVLTIDAKESIEAVAQAVRETDTCAEILALKTNDVFIKHREMKDLKILDELF